MDWRDRSACLDEDPELFFPIGNTGPAILQIEEAKQVCRRCEVREQCLQWALEAGQDHGVDVRTILVELGRRRMVGGQEDMITDVALDLAKSGAGRKI